MPRSTILIVEDEPKISHLLRDYLRQAGYETRESLNYDQIQCWVEQEEINLILLDWMLPGMNGLEICQQLRTISTVPILMITARVEEIDRLKGLDSGADDYITKPFSSVILLARVKAVLRRGLVSNTDLQRIVINQGIKVDPNARNAFIDDSKIVLTFTEFQILYLLVSHPGWVFTRYQIIDRIRGEKHPVTDRSVDFQIVGLRKKMGHKGKLIETIRGVGYRFHLNET